MKSCPSCRRKFVDTQETCPLDNGRLEPASGTLPPGVGRELGTYQLVCLLGEGGMGNIYIARHMTLGRYVAIKQLRPELATRKETIARFFQEAHTINALKHPNIVESIDLVEDVVDGAYCVLELLKGPDLKARLARGPLSIESAVQIGTQLADALGKVHSVGVVHRDLKPENLILVERDGRDDFVKLIDFGIAQIGEHGAGIAGTAAYMAPEQAEKKAQVDRRADIYALGVILFEMVTGRHPFPSETDSGYLIAHAHTKPPRPSKLNPRCPAALEAVILRCMEKQPEARFASADQVSAALRMVMIDARAGGSGSRAGAIAAGLVLAAGAGAAAFFLVPKYLNKSEAKPTVQTAEPAPAPAPSPSPAPDVVAKAEPAPAAKVEEAPAPAADEKPVEPPPEALPAIVDIGIISSPAGVTVYRVGETVALGVTPFTVPLPRSAKPVEMRFEKPGFQSKTIEVPVEESLEVEVSMSKQRDKVASTVKMKKSLPPPSTEQKPAKGVQREGVMDPFANP